MKARFTQTLTLSALTPEHGFGPHGWSDQFTDESQRSDLQWEHTLDVRPASLLEAVGGPPPHSFIACVWVTPYAWDENAKEGKGDWVQGEPALVYYGEHPSLGAGVAATRKARARSLLLRDGPRDS